VQGGFSSRRSKVHSQHFCIALALGCEPHTADSRISRKERGQPCPRVFKTGSSLFSVEWSRFFAPTEGPEPSGFRARVPQGRPKISPRFQPWVADARTTRAPQGRKKAAHLAPQPRSGRGAAFRHLSARFALGLRCSLGRVSPRIHSLARASPQGKTALAKLCSILRSGESLEQFSRRLVHWFR